MDPLDLLQKAACEGTLVRHRPVRRRDEGAGLRDGAQAGPEAAREEVAEAAILADVGRLRLGNVDGEEFDVEPDEEDCAWRTAVRSHEKEGVNVQYTDR